MSLKYLIVIGFVLLFVPVFAQSNPDEIYADIVRLNQKGMLVLGSWAIGNIVMAVLMLFRKNGHSTHFWQMNMAWNTINLGIAIFAYLGKSADWESLSALFITIENYNRAYLFNGGLDVAYLMAGFYLKELSYRKQKYAAILKGFGWAMILQGSFLLVFDLVMYVVNINYFNLNIAPWIDTLNRNIGLNFSF